MPVAPGSLAPAAETLTLAGEAADLEALAALGPALLFFYKGDCEASAASAHAVARLAAIPGLTVAAVSQDGEEETLAFAAEHRFGPARVWLLRDPPPWPASTAYGIDVTPTWVLLGRSARVEAVAEGWSRDEANALAAKATALLGQPAPRVSSPEDGPAFRPG